MTKQKEFEVRLYRSEDFGYDTTHIHIVNLDCLVGLMCRLCLHPELKLKYEAFDILSDGVVVYSAARRDSIAGLILSELAGNMDSKGGVL